MVGRDGDECRHDVVVGLHGERAGARPIADVPGPQGEPGPPGGTRGHGHLGSWRQVEGARVRTVDPVRLGGEPPLAAAVRRDGEHEVARRRGRAHRREFRADFQVGVELQIACAGSGARPGPTFERRARRRDRLEVNGHARRHRRRAIARAGHLWRAHGAGARDEHVQGPLRARRCDGFLVSRRPRTGDAEGGRYDHDGR